MKLVYLTTCFGTPSHTFIRREINELSRQGHEVHLYGIRKDTNIAPDAEPLVEQTEYLYPVSFSAIINAAALALRSATFWRLFGASLKAHNGSLKQRLKLIYHLVLSVKFANVFKQAQYEHIHIHFLHVPSSVGLFAAKLTGISVSITIHSAGEKNLPHVDGIPLKLAAADQLLMISRFNIDYYHAIWPCEARSNVVRCGMNINDFEFRSQPLPQNHTLRVLAIGRFVEKKGFIYLLQAAKMLKDRGFTFELTVLGSGPLEQDFKHYVAQHQLTDVVQLPGQASTDTVKQTMLASDLVVVPSVTSHTGEMEGIPVVLMEAMVSGVPVIASAHSGIPELITPETGILVAEKDAAALADAIQQFSYNAHHVAKARQLIENEFNIRTVVEKRVELFRNL